MRKVSKAFKKKMNNGTQAYATCRITFRDGNIKNLDKGDFVMDSPLALSTATSSHNSFDIGAVVIGQLTLNINNYNGKWDAFDFDGAKIDNVRLSVDLENGTTESVLLGIYTVDEQTFVGGKITLVALDNLAILDTRQNEYSDDTAESIVRNIALYNGLSVDASKMNNKNMPITIPEGLEYTDRQLLSYILQVTCNYAICGDMGDIVIKWYDFSVIENIINAKTFDSPAIDIINAGFFVGMDERDIINAGLVDSISDDVLLSIVFDATVDIDDVVVTGIKVIDDDETEYMSGSEGYVLSIVDNPLTKGNEQIIADSVANVVVGHRFRPLQATILNNPLVEAGDVGYVTIRGVNYLTAFTNVEYVQGRHTEINCYAESPGKNSSERMSQTVIERQKTKEYVNEQTDSKISAYDVAVQQLTTLMSQSFGIFKTEEVQPDGSTIYYMHNKPTRAESQTQWKMTASGLAVSTDYGQTWNAGITAEGNAVVNVLSAVGVTADWIKAGTIEGEIIAKNLKMQGGSIDLTTDSEIRDSIKLKYNDYLLEISPSQIKIAYDGNSKYECILGQLGSIVVRKYLSATKWQQTNVWHNHISISEITSTSEAVISMPIAEIGRNGSENVLTLGFTDLTETQLEKLLELIQ